MNLTSERREIQYAGTGEVGTFKRVTRGSYSEASAREYQAEPRG